MKAIDEYLAELEKLTEDLKCLKHQKEQCVESCTQDAPDEVKLERSLRHKTVLEITSERAVMPARDVKREGSSKPSDLYYMIGVNIKHKKAIKELRQDIREKVEAKEVLEGKYASLREALG